MSFGRVAAADTTIHLPPNPKHTGQDDEEKPFDSFTLAQKNCVYCAQNIYPKVFLR